MIKKILNRIESTSLRKTLQGNRRIAGKNLAPIGLFCMPRGGSTWLMEILQEHLNAAIVWEPLFRGKYESTGRMPTYTRTGLEDLKRLNFWYYQSIARNEDLPEVYDFFSRLFTGQIGDKSILFKNNIKELEQADRLLFKFCFANLMLPYLAHNFQLKSIVLHRHPCAVVASQLNHKGGWLNPKVLSGFSIPDVSNKDLFLKYEDVLASITTVEESLAALWCLNYVVASSVSSQDLLHIEYETLLIDTETTLKKIGQLINVALPYDQILEQVTTPSKTSNTKESIDPQKQIRRWQTALTSKQIDLIVKMVDRFQITKYNEDVVPVT